jgi:hypothetical protein
LMRSMLVLPNKLLKREQQRGSSGVRSSWKRNSLGMIGCRKRAKEAILWVGGRLRLKLLPGAHRIGDQSLITARSFFSMWARVVRNSHGKPQQDETWCGKEAFASFISTSVSAKADEEYDWEANNFVWVKGWF